MRRWREQISKRLKNQKIIIEVRGVQRHSEWALDIVDQNGTMLEGFSVLDFNPPEELNEIKEGSRLEITIGEYIEGAKVLPPKQ